MMGPYRNHPVLLVKYILICMFIGFVLTMTTTMVEFGLLALIPLFLFVRIWFKTRYTFTEDGIEVERSTAFKTDTNIPYSKVSSINVVRTILDRLLGTVTVSFNINSGVNASTPEVSLVLDIRTSEELKAFVESKIHGDTESIQEEEYEAANVVTFTDVEVILHSFLSMPTGSIVSSIAVLIYSILQLMYGDKTGISGMFAMFLFIFTMVMPIARQLLRYFNFKAYRSGDIIYLEHGMFQTYHSSFDVSRVNAVRFQSPLIPRLMGKSSIQAEVIGINAMSNDSTPTLCLMTTNEHNRRILETLLPEFVSDDRITLQPKEARVPLFLKAMVYSLIASGIVASLCIAMFMCKSELVADIGEIPFYTIIACAVALAAIYVIACIFGCFVSMRSIGHHFGEDRFTLVFGVVDRVTTIMQYDRVQMATEISDPISRHYGLSKCRISFLSALGAKGDTRSGYMTEDDARVVSDTILARIRDGRYDYRKNEI